MFIDEIKIFVKSGKGGDGCVSFRREKNVPRGGPDGGDGGKGGDIIIEVDANLNSLSHLYYHRHFKAGKGTHGKGKKMHGKDGKDVVIKVPPGTLVYKNSNLLADLVKPDDHLIAARGGKGGRGNIHFVTSTHRAPKEFELGQEGKEKQLKLELKLIADVGLVGYPNAGKSTLLKRVSDAKPKIASYPFTTLTPNLGVIHGESLDITVADIPGIIEGAHKGKGLGLTFLRHIERTKLLLFIIDITGSPLENYKILREEIRQYNPLILKKPSLVAFNKIDLTQPNVPKLPVTNSFYISALKGDVIDTLISAIRNKLKKV
jgi:GTP-binding protein